MSVFSKPKESYEKEGYYHEDLCDNLGSKGKLTFDERLAIHHSDCDKYEGEKDPRNEIKRRG